MSVDHFGGRLCAANHSPRPFPQLSTFEEKGSPQIGKILAEGACPATKKPTGVCMRRKSSFLYH